MVAWSLTLAIIGFFLGGVTHLGYCRFQLNLLDQKPAQLSDLFSQFHRFGAGFCLNLLTGLFIFLWSLLLFVPGLIAAYRYAMAPYILAEDPGCTASEALARSTEMMRGYNGPPVLPGPQLLRLAAAGNSDPWHCNLWVNPYSTLSTAAFYRLALPGEPGVRSARARDSITIQRLLSKEAATNRNGSNRFVLWQPSLIAGSFSIPLAPPCRSFVARRQINPST